MFYVAGVLDAIAHLHTHDIVFRDLKPENIMVDADGFPKLIDLGFAKKLHHLRTFTICGTPEYLAPEMLEKTNKSGYGKAVDYWGIGILIYELLAGYPPFYDNEEPRNIYKKILKGVIEFPEFFSLRARHVILSLLNPNPAKRLGARNNGEDIKQHPWFRKFDWSDIRNAKVPWKPPIKDPHDATNF